MTEQPEQPERAPQDGDIVATPVASSAPGRVALEEPRAAVADAPPPAKQGPTRSRAVVEWVVLIVAALLIALVVRTFVFQAFYIPSPSMVPTLEVGDRVLVNKLSYDFGDPERGDVVVFKAPPGAATPDMKDLVKRIVGLPNDTIEGHDGHIYINGHQLDEPYLPASVQSKTFAPVHVPPNSYFMLGDNRQSSRDSTVFGPVKGSTFIGSVFLTIWPLDRISIPLWPFLLIGSAILVLIALWILLGRRSDVT